MGLLLISLFYYLIGEFNNNIVVLRSDVIGMFLLQLAMVSNLSRMRMVRLCFAVNFNHPSVDCSSCGGIYGTHVHIH